MSNFQQSNYRTQIERNFFAALAKNNLTIPIMEQDTWYFSASFSDMSNGSPQGYLRRYAPGDDLLHPTSEVVIAGRVVGNVRFEQGRAIFDGSGYIEFSITQDQIAAAEGAKPMDESLLNPRALLMLAAGKLAEAARGNAPVSNPVLFYRSGLIEFGLFVPDGSICSKINSEVHHSISMSPPTHINAALWSVTIEPIAGSDEEIARNRLLHKIVDPNSFSIVDKREFELQNRVQVPLRPGIVFSIGYAPLPGVAPFRGEISEVIFDPAGGNGDGGTGKPGWI